MATAHLILSPLHGRQIEFGPNGYSAPGYSEQARGQHPTATAHSPWNDDDYLILVHDSIETVEEREQAVADYSATLGKN